MNTLLAKEKGTWVLLSFIAFFGVIVAVNMVFMTYALSTHSGVVTDRPYEKGLAFNDILQAARIQPPLNNTATFSDGVLRWTIANPEGDALTNATVTAKLVRAVQNGYDIDITLHHTRSGIYEATLQLPLRGAWTARLKATWDDQTFQTTHALIAP